jgi:YVTN family beta-propeller protein
LRIALLGLLSFLLTAPATAQTRLYPLQARYLSVVDAATFQTLATVDLIRFGNPAGIAIPNTGTRAYVGLGGVASGILPSDPPGAAAGPQNRVAVIDLFTLTVIRTIEVGIAPTEVVASPSGDRIYAASPGANTISVIRTSDDTVVGTITMPAPFGSQSELAVTSNGSKLYAVGFIAGTATLFEITPRASPSIHSRRSGVVRVES